MNSRLHERLFLAVLAASVLSVAALPALAASCGACDLTQERCAANCMGREVQSERLACLIACDNAAATCSCDEAVTLRSEDLIAKTAARPVGDAPACHSTTPCGSAYPSCASWSGYSDCDDPWCGIYKFCGDPPYCEEPDLCFGPALRQSRERYRVCFNAQSQACTEYQRTSVVLGCGC